MESFEKPRYMMATTAIHKLGDISRTLDIALVFAETETDYYGNWVSGIGLVNVRFPKKTTRELTKEEKNFYSTQVVITNNHIRPFVFEE